MSQKHFSRKCKQQQQTLGERCTGRGSKAAVWLLIGIDGSLSASAKDAGPNVLVFGTGWRKGNRVKGMPIVTGCLLKDTVAVGSEL